MFEDFAISDPNYLMSQLMAANQPSALDRKKARILGRGAVGQSSANRTARTSGRSLSDQLFEQISNSLGGSVTNSGQLTGGNRPAQAELPMTLAERQKILDTSPLPYYYYDSSGNLYPHLLKLYQDQGLDVSKYLTRG